MTRRKKTLTEMAEDAADKEATALASYITPATTARAEVARYRTGYVDGYLAGRRAERRAAKRRDG
jgi:hypothetical protein